MRENFQFRVKTDENLFPNVVPLNLLEKDRGKKSERKSIFMIGIENNTKLLKEYC